VYDELIKERKENKNSIFVKTEYRLEQVLFSDICFIEGFGDYRKVQTSLGKILTLHALSSFESELPATQFCCVHKSYIVAIDKIISIERNRIKIQDVSLSLSDNYRESFLKLIGIKQS